MELWTERYKPKKLEEVVSQEKPIRETLDFLGGFKKGKALLFAGPPGTGKTLVAELVSKEKNFQLVRINASDKRGASEIESLFDGAAKNRPLFWKGKIILFDEADGIAPTDRGATGAIAKIIKESPYPVILVANDAYATKLRDVRKYCKIVKFSRVRSLSIEKKLKEIAQAEGVTIPTETVSALAKWSNGDMRSAIIDLQIVCLGKKIVDKADIETLGYRERLADVFSVLPTLFFSGSISSGKKAINESDKDADEVFWWIETNIAKVFKDADSLAVAYDLLSKADIMRGRVQKQQNWRFKSYMADMLSGLSAAANAKRGFVMFQPPDRFVQMGATKTERAGMAELCRKLGVVFHCSSKTVREDYLPFLKIIAGENEDVMKDLGIGEEEMKLI